MLHDLINKETYAIDDRSILHIIYIFSIKTQCKKLNNRTLWMYIYISSSFIKSSHRLSQYLHARSLARSDEGFEKKKKMRQLSSTHTSELDYYLKTLVGTTNWNPSLFFSKACMLSAIGIHYCRYRAVCCYCCFMNARVHASAFPLVLYIVSLENN
jgi:hypothetical protein